MKNMISFKMKMRYLLVAILLVVSSLCLSACGSGGSGSAGGSSMLADLRDQFDEEMSNYYFDSFEYVDSEYLSDLEVASFTYQVSYDSTYYSYNGKVTLSGQVFESGDQTGYYAEDLYLDYNDDFEWDINGNWASTSPAIEVIISDIDQDSEFIYYNATGYGSNGVFWHEIKSESTGDTSSEYIIDYTGHDHYTLGRTIEDSDSEDEINYDPPTLSFTFYVKGYDYVVTVNPETVECERGGADKVKGDLERNCSLSYYENEYGNYEYELVGE